MYLIYPSLTLQHLLKAFKLTLKLVTTDRRTLPCIAAITAKKMKVLLWDVNSSFIVKKVNARMQLLRSVKSFGASIEETVHLWTVFGRSVLEQSCAHLWNPC